MKTIFYLMSQEELSEEDAKAMIVRGFAYPIAKELTSRICSRNE